MSGSTAIAGCSTSSSVNEVTISQTRSLELTRKRTVRCNRKAAYGIKRIEFSATEARSANTNVRRLEESDDEKTDDVKRSRLSSDHLELNDLGDATRCPGSTPERECSPQADHYSPELHGKNRFGYSFVGPGKCLYALHLETGVQKQCQIIDQTQYQQIIKVRQRLNEADKYWKDEDVSQMSNFVLPAETELYEWGQGRYLYLSPWQYDTLNVEMLSAKGKDGKEDVVRHLFRQIVRGVAFCHALGIIVRDLKPRKFTFVDKERTTLRLHDVLGLYVCEHINDDIMVDHHGVPAYVAPEVLRRVPVEYAGKPADIWALGVLLYYLLFGRHPFNDSTLPRVFMRICRVSFCIPSGMYASQPARILIHGIFKKEPSERPTAEQLLHLRWFSETLDPTISLYPAWRPSVNAITGVAGNRQGVSFPSNRSGTGNSHIYRRFRNHRSSEEIQVVPGGTQGPNAPIDSRNVVTATHHIENIAYSLSRRSLPNLAQSGSVL